MFFNQINAAFGSDGNEGVVDELGEDPGFTCFEEGVVFIGLVVDEEDGAVGVGEEEFMLVDGLMLVVEGEADLVSKLVF